MYMYVLMCTCLYTLCIYAYVCTYVRKGVDVSMYVCIVFVCMYICMFTCVVCMCLHVDVCVNMEAKGGCQESFSKAFHLSFFETGSVTEPVPHRLAKVASREILSLPP